MFDFVPIEYYTDIYYHVFFVIIIIALFHSQLLRIDETKNILFMNIFGWISLFFSLLYLGLRPIHKVFVDMEGYAYFFTRAQEGNKMNFDIDFGFFEFLNISSKLMTVNFFFFVCAFLYVMPLWIIATKWYKEYRFYGFLIMIISFSFWAYGANGIRNGIATSLFLLAISYNNKKIIMLLLLIISSSFHKTMLLPSIAYFITFFYNDTNRYIKFWLVAIPLSLFLGSFWVALFANFDLGDRRVDAYFTEDVDATLFRSTEFRWDFLLYSATGVFAGWYFIIKKEFKDVFYIRLFNVYLIVNAFWILIIRANFSNRFAYLSWFMLGIIIIYPLLKQKIVPNQNKMIGMILFIYFLFTYIMNVILTKL